VNNVNLSTGTTNTGFIAKLDATGNTTWAFSVGAPGGYQHLSAIHATPAAILVAGNFTFGMTLNGPQTPVTGNAGFLASLAPNGTVQWVQTYEDASVSGVTRDSAGDIVLSGSVTGTQSFGGADLVVSNQSPDPFLAKLSSSGTHVWSKSYPGAVATGGAVAVDQSDNILMSGTYNGVIDLGAGALPSDSGQDAFVLQVQP
jgi:hypothetical protein